jgi:hypothetical protein
VFRSGTLFVPSWDRSRLIVATPTPSIFAARGLVLTHRWCVNERTSRRREVSKAPISASARAIPATSRWWVKERASRRREVSKARATYPCLDGGLELIARHGIDRKRIRGLRLGKTSRRSRLLARACANLPKQTSIVLVFSCRYQPHQLAYPIQSTSLDAIRHQPRPPLPSLRLLPRRSALGRGAPHSGAHLVHRGQQYEAIASALSAQSLHSSIFAPRYVLVSCWRGWGNGRNDTTVTVIRKRGCKLLPRNSRPRRHQDAKFAVAKAGGTISRCAGFG